MLINPYFLALIHVLPNRLVDESRLCGRDLRLDCAMSNRYRPNRSRTAVSSIEQVLDAIASHDVHDMAPWSEFLRGRLVDARPGHVDVKFQRQQHIMVEDIGFEAIPNARSSVFRGRVSVSHCISCRERWMDGNYAPTTGILHDFAEEVLLLRVHDLVPRVVLDRVLPWHFAELVLLEEVEVGQLFGVRELRGVVDAFLLGHAYAVEVLVELELREAWTIDHVVECLYVRRWRNIGIF